MGVLPAAAGWFSSAGCDRQFPAAGRARRGIGGEPTARDRRRRPRAAPSRWLVRVPWPPPRSGSTRSSGRVPGLPRHHAPLAHPHLLRPVRSAKPAAVTRSPDSSSVSFREWCAFANSHRCSSVSVSHSARRRVALDQNQISHNQLPSGGIEPDRNRSPWLMPKPKDENRRIPGITTIGKA